MKKYYFLIFFLIFLNNAFAEQKTVYIDVNFLLSKSEAGIYINNELKKINDKNIEDFKKFESKLKSEEADILKQKNILKEKDFNSKVKALRIKYDAYNEKKINTNSELKKMRDNAANKLLTAINEILKEYSLKNSISLMIDKKNIVIGKTQLDITNDILELLNKKISNISLN